MCVAAECLKVCGCKSTFNPSFNAVDLTILKIADLSSFLKDLDKTIDSDTVFVFQGAGDISAISKAIAKEFYSGSH